MSGNSAYLPQHLLIVSPLSLVSNKVTVCANKKTKKTIIKEQQPLGDVFIVLRDAVRKNYFKQTSLRFVFSLYMGLIQRRGKIPDKIFVHFQGFVYFEGVSICVGSCFTREV